MAPPIQETFHKVPKFIQLTAGLTIYVLMPLACFWPDLFPFHIIADYNHALRVAFYITITLHLTEAVTAVMLCAYMDCSVNVTRKWAVSIFINGIFGFYPLMMVLYEYELRMDPKKSKNIRQEFDFVR